MPKNNGFLYASDNALSLITFLKSLEFLVKSTEINYFFPENRVGNYFVLFNDSITISSKPGNVL